MAEWPSSHGSRLATFDAASKLRAGQETGGSGFPKGVVGEMGLGVTQDCDYILNMLSIFELGPEILVTHSLNWIGRCREMVGILCAFKW